MEETIIIIIKITEIMKKIITTKTIIIGNFNL